MDPSPAPANRASTSRSSIDDEDARKRYNQIATRQLVRKLDRRVLSFYYVLEMSLYINRISIGHASLMNMTDDLHLSKAEAQWAVALFYVAYVIFEMPSIILMRKVGPASYLTLSMFVWGGITIGMAFVSNAAELLAVRFLLGVAQSAFFPTIIIYISLWYRKGDHTMRIAIIYSAALLASALGSILAYGFKNMDDMRGLQGWQWMFLIEGLPLIPLGLITCLLLSDTLDGIQWLNNDERNRLTDIVHSNKDPDQSPTTRLCWRQVRDAFLDWRVYLLALITMGDLGVVKYLSTSLPSLVFDMTGSKTSVQLLTAPPYVFAFLACLAVAYSSSRANELGLHLAGCLSVGILGFILTGILTDASTTALYVVNCLTCCGVYAALPLIFSWITQNVNGDTKRSVAVGLANLLGQFGGIIFPFITNNKWRSTSQNAVCIGALTLSLALTIVLRVLLTRENRRRATDNDPVAQNVV